jgi:hypothetical protein
MIPPYGVGTRAPCCMAAQRPGCVPVVLHRSAGCFGYSSGWHLCVWACTVVSSPCCALHCVLIPGSWRFSCLTKAGRLGASAVLVGVGGRQHMCCSN